MSSLTLIIGNKNYSSWSLRPWLVLKQAGIDFDEIRIPLDMPTTREQLLRYSPTGKVPVLQHDDLTIWESIAICEYVAELAPDRGLLPQDVKARAVMRSVAAEMHAGFAALRQHFPMDCRARIADRGTPAQVQADIDRILLLWRNCREQFGRDGDFLFGAPFTIADAMFAPVVSRFVTYGVPLDEVSQAYADRIWSLPAMQEWLSAAAAEVETISY